MRKMTTALIWILLVLFVCFKIIGEVDAEVQVSILSPLNFTKLNAPTILQLWVWRNIFERSKRGWAQLTRLAIPPALVKSLYTGGHNVCTFWFTERMPAQNPLTSLLKPSPTRVTLFTLTKRKLLYSINRRTIQKSSPQVPWELVRSVQSRDPPKQHLLYRTAWRPASCMGLWPCHPQKMLLINKNVNHSEFP